MVVWWRLNTLSENIKPNNNKKTPIFVIAGVAAFIAILAFTGMVGEKADDRVVDALSSNQELQDQITVLQSQINATIVILQAHENVLRQHDVQIQGLNNNTNVIGNWASEFSNNINDRVTTLEGE